jgi:hypothetical protein
MADYFFLVNPGSGIHSEVNVTRFVSNKLKTTMEVIDFKVFVYTQAKNSVVWKKIDEKMFNSENNICLKSTDYDLDVGELAVIIPADISEVASDYCDTLPKPLSRRVDFSVINERAALSFHKEGSFTSYQGEYPHQMSKIKGTFLGFDPLVQTDASSVRTMLVFVNIFSQQLHVKDMFKLCTADAHNKNLIAGQLYTHNSAAILTISSLAGAKVFYSKNTTGVPIFLSYSSAVNSNISVEHTHPPAELFLDKIEGQKEIKYNWLSKLP